MSVYTPLNLSQVQTFAQPYGLNIVEIQPIQAGIENTNYFLINEDRQQYVLTVFESLNQQAVEEIIPALQHLGNHHIPVAVPLVHHNRAIHHLAGKPAQIAPRLLGSHPHDCNTAQAQAMGKALANMHLALLDFPLQRQENHNHAWWLQQAQRLRPTMDAQEQQLLDKVLHRFADFVQKHDCPKGLIHADLFRDNSLYQGDELSGILDFSELNHDYLLMDLAISMNDFCSQFPQVTLDPQRTTAFLTAYQTVRPLTAQEQQGLPIFLSMAACRFWLLRLGVKAKNHSEGRLGDDILQKDPQEMKDMLIQRLDWQMTA